MRLRILKRICICLLLALVLGLALSGNAFAQEPTSTTLTTGASKKDRLRDIRGQWRLVLQQRQMQDEFNQKNLTEFRFYSTFHYAPVENITFTIAPMFFYANGFTQTKEGQNASRSEWGVREASINASISALTASAGALDQTPAHPSSLLENQTFPAAQLHVKTDAKAQWVFGAQAQSAIPTSSSLSTQTQDFEKTPGFQSGSLYVKAQKMSFEGSLRAGAYQFQNLPISVATKSALLGNTTEPTSGTNSQFIYDYEGSFAELDAKVWLTRSWNIGGRAEWLQNSKAPQDFNQGTLARAFSTVRVLRDLDIAPFYEYFRIEPDATVALYSLDTIGTNRVGYRSGLQLTYKQAIKFSVSAGERDVIFVSPYQQREKTLQIRLETFDVSI